MDYFKITKIWAFLAIEKDGEGKKAEGVTAFMDPSTRQWFPLVAADQRRLETLMPVAIQIAKETGRVVKLVEFSTRKEIETILPDKGSA